MVTSCTPHADQNPSGESINTGNTALAIRSWVAVNFCEASNWKQYRRQIVKVRIRDRERQRDSFERETER